MLHLTRKNSGGSMHTAKFWTTSFLALWEQRREDRAPFWQTVTRDGVPVL